MGLVDIHLISNSACLFYIYKNIFLTSPHKKKKKQFSFIKMFAFKITYGLNNIINTKENLVLPRLKLLMIFTELTLVWHKVTRMWY